jgi:carbamoyl-phosphate synthase large subunit
MIKKVILIGSGPIIIGQAAEFDYSGTQACKAIKEEGIEVVLINSNPATIMTDENIADKVYIEPLTTDVIEKIIIKEKPDGILAGFGGQTALTLAMKLYDEGILDKYGVKLLGINIEAIKKAEDREEFKELLEEIGEPVAKSKIVNKLEEGIEFTKEIGYPIILRPAYTLGGTGGGIANNEKEFIEICERALKLSPIHQVLVEQSVAGWKEIEYEVMRDKKGNCITVCNMENLDPVGVHTGDSIVVAPSQTLSNKEYQMLRESSFKIVSALNIEGGCNVQFALNPNSYEYIVIEVNPRVSRSSALASKATGYPIAKIAAKIALGYSLDELKNSVTKKSSAFFEPALDYIVFKLPKWPFDKFKTASKSLSTQMKATGEVMAIDRTFEGALMKAISSIEGGYTGLNYNGLKEKTNEELINELITNNSDRIFAIAELFRRDYSIEDIFNYTKIDRWFLKGIHNIIDLEKKLKENPKNIKYIKEAEKIGFVDDEIIRLSKITKKDLDDIREESNLYPTYKMVDTCSGEFEAATPYYYSCYESTDENIITDNKKIIIIGSGPIRIGQGIEFDYCSVHAIWAAKERGYEAIIINNNPETVSTDFDTSDKLYFESLYIDDVLNIVREEKPEGVIVQFGGQTSINLTERLEKAGIKILGSDFKSIDLAEDREKFREFLEELNIKSPIGDAVSTIDEARELIDKIGYPVIVRPSYVIGGRAMKVINSDNELVEYFEDAKKLDTVSILVDKYLYGTEIEVDAISDGEDILIPGIMEHIEKTGIHSGDSISAYPPINLSEELKEKLVETTKKIAINLKTKGLINIQYVYYENELYIIEVNPRASRTVPILSKVTGIPMVKIAVDIMFGDKLKDMKYGTGLAKEKEFYSLKFPVFSTEKLSDVDIFLGPEMKSTGEILAIDKKLENAIYKGFKAYGLEKIENKKVYVSFSDISKEKGKELVKKYIAKGYEIYSSGNTYKYLKEFCDIIEIDKENISKELKEKQIELIINIPTFGNNPETFGFKLRRKAAENKIPLFTAIETAELYLKVYEADKDINYYTVKEYLEM